MRRGRGSLGCKLAKANSKHFRFLEEHQRALIPAEKSRADYGWLFYAFRKLPFSQNKFKILCCETLFYGRGFFQIVEIFSAAWEAGRQFGKF
ncbi:hypothetical protein [Faecalispora anaeroviscerum]|uniref:hypothetical protein n=1 Tax=Faecalispora anaeroviscerum TaxID=2991836 RepID=UPI0024B9926D|nr:hypothetical protein [Faecalispora anaeroviscerum]